MNTPNIKATSKKDFLDKVFPAEIKEIKQRRKTVSQDAEPLDDTPKINNGIVGLAISGGGIRSATFSLGVVQGLARQGILKKIDYLSTVSGGGYTGSCLSSLLNDPDNHTDGDRFPLKYRAGSEEPPSLTHLRNSSNYLTPGGLLDKLRLPNVLLRGILLNLFIFMPFIMAAVFITEVAYEKGPHWDKLTSLLLPLSLFFLLMSLIFPFAVRLLRRFFNWQKRNSYELWLTVPLLLVAIILMIIPVLFITRQAIEHNMDQVLVWISQFSAQTLWISGAIAAGIAVLFMMAGKASQNLAKLRGKLLLFIVGLLGPAFVFMIYLGLCLWQIDSPYLPISATDPLNKASECQQPCLVQSALTNENQDQASDHVSPDVSSFFTQNEIRSTEELVYELKGRSVSLSEKAVVKCASNNCDQEFPTEQWRQDNRIWVINNAPDKQPACPPLEEVGPMDDAGIEGNCHYLSRDSRDQLRIEGDKLRLFEKSNDYIFLLVFLGFLIFNRFFLDMNITSLHGFYRDRLSKAYLFNIDDHNEVKHADNIKLSSLNAEGSTAPYHIINVALNLQASKDIDLRGRKSDFFIFSKHYTGSDRTGYAPTTEIEKYDQSLDLGTAMAISGAAAAPNMGDTTYRSLVFIMTLLNIRLGYWLPNPKTVNSKHWFNWLNLSGAKPTLIWREALGKLDAKGSHVNISDGGHIENMAIYPLLKRRCKTIIAIDGEADPNMTFGGLVKLMRYARIDMGVKIDIDLEKLRKDEAGLSNSHWAVGDIYYGKGEQGKLIYIKLAVTGKEPEYIRAYRSDNPRYPHEPTSDQFFSEDQFEAYRALGSFACSDMASNADAINTLLSSNK